jgi:predicted Zn-dependent protease
MEKIVTKFFILVISFFGIWWGLSRIDWMTILHVEEVTQNTQEKLGELYWDIFKQIEKEIDDHKLIAPVDSLLTHICNRNDIDREKIKLHLIEKGDINAFALPDHHLVLFSGLIQDCQNESELAGVIAHELAHLEKGHIMKKLTKEIGLGVLLSMTTGNGSPEIIQQALKVLTSSAYDRSLELEADITGAEYLIRAGLDAEAFAGFLFRMNTNESTMPKQVFWISTHPGAEDRTQAIVDYIKDRKYTMETVLDSSQWTTLKDNLSGL